MMYLHEVCRQTGLTRKAVEYYEAHGLVHPDIQENGYRQFSQQDVARLQKVSVLRKLGLSVSEMADALDGSLQDALARQEIRHALEQERLELLRTLVQEGDWEAVQKRLAQLEVRQTIMLRLTEAFPGSYGAYLAWHFAPFLDMPVVTSEQAEAYDAILAFLDETSFEVPPDFSKMLDELPVSVCKRASEAYREALQDPETFIRENRAVLESRMAARKESDDSMQLRQLHQSSGYYDRFIPAMMRLSPAYREHHAQLKRMEEALTAAFPDWNA